MPCNNNVCLTYYKSPVYSPLSWKFVNIQAIIYLTIYNYSFMGNHTTRLQGGKWQKNQKISLRAL